MTIRHKASEPESPGGARYGAGRGGRAWRRLRWRVLVRDCFTCQSCGQVFPPDRLDCDHVTPLAAGGTDDMGNLQTLCRPCHQAKTDRDMGHRQRQAIGADGWPVEHRTHESVEPYGNAHSAYPYGRGGDWYGTGRPRLDTDPAPNFPHPQLD